MADSTITREMIEASARALYLKDRGVPDDAWDRDLPESTMELWRGYARAALTASATAMFGAKRQPHYTHAMAGVEGMSATLHLRDGSLELVFKDGDLEFINEEGRDLHVARLPASEVFALRQWLIDYLPEQPADAAPPAPTDPIPEPGVYQGGTATDDSSAATLLLERGCNLIALWRDLPYDCCPHSLDEEMLRFEEALDAALATGGDRHG